MQINQKKENSYILATGKETEYRLSILNKIYGKYTNILLNKIGLSPGMKVAIIGCGSGEGIEVIYQKIGSNGKLLCIDVSQNQINLTKTKLNDQNIDIAKYQIADIQEYQGDGQYDLVVLMHLINPQKALNNMVSMLKNNGLIVCEEHVSKTIFNYPYASSIEKYKELLHKIETELNVDYSYGIKLFNTLCNLNLQDIQFDFYQPVFNYGEEKSLLKLSLLEEKEHYIQHNLIDNLEIEKMLKEMDEIIQDKKAIQSPGGVLQSWGRKNAHNESII